MQYQPVNESRKVPLLKIIALRKIAESPNFFKLLFGYYLRMRFWWTLKRVLDTIFYEVRILKCYIAVYFCDVFICGQSVFRKYIWLHLGTPSHPVCYTQRLNNKDFLFWGRCVHLLVNFICAKKKTLEVSFLKSVLVKFSIHFFPSLQACLLEQSLGIEGSLCCSLTMLVPRRAWSFSWRECSL